MIGILAPDFEIGLERGRGRRGPRHIYVPPKEIAEYETFICCSGWWHVIARVRPEVTLGEA